MVGSKFRVFTIAQFWFFLALVLYFAAGLVEYLDILSFPSTFAVLFSLLRAAYLERSVNGIYLPPTWKLPHRNVQSGHDKGVTFCSKSCGGDRCRAPGSHH